VLVTLAYATAVNVSGGNRLGGMTVDELIEAAQQRTGFGDLGPPGFREALEVLVESAVTEGRLNELGHATLAEGLVGHLANRLRCIDWAAKHPEVRDERIAAPLVITGMPRPGTTLLSFLFDLDPFNRSLLAWEAGDICPPPTLEQRGGADPRVRRTIERSELLDAFAPQIQLMHPMPPTGPTECVTLLASDFRSILFETQAFIEGYGAWCDEADFTSAYEMHRLQLQILQSTMPTERWSLKTPGHLWKMAELFRTYPDAMVVWTHRDPVKTVGSVASLVAALQGLGSSDVRPAELGPAWAAKFERAIAAADAVRERVPSDRVVDLGFTDLMADPVAAVERTYAHFGLPVGDLHRRRMVAWMEQNPRDKRGVHRYDVEDFGLSAGEVRERFAGYVERYGVARE
jgi:hypothetical protein